MKKEPNKIEKQEIDLREIKTSYDNIEYIYSNQSMIQLSSEDIDFVFGSMQFDCDGQIYKNLTHSIRMSHEHFKKFVQNCNKQLEILEDIKKQENTK